MRNFLINLSRVFELNYFSKGAHNGDSSHHLVASVHFITIYICTHTHTLTHTTRIEIQDICVKDLNGL
jgi:hypothetical protein